MSDYDNSSINRKPTANNDIIAGLIITIVVLLLAIVCILGYNLFIKTIALENKDILIWLIFMLFAAAISCVIDVIISHVSKKSEENKEKNMIQEIKNIFDEKIGEIKSGVNVALKKSDLVFGNQETILHMLMDLSMDIDKIEKIMILAHTSDSFSGFFKDYFKKKEFKCKELNILIHDQAVNGNSGVIKDWNYFCKKNKIKHEIRKAKIKRRSFFGMIIEFERESYHRIGMIGFYKPQNEEVLPYKRYGVFSEDSSILDVLNEYFDYYFDDNYSTVILENENPEPN